MRIAAILPILSLLLLLFGGCKAEPADAGVPRSETAPALETTTAPRTTAFGSRTSLRRLCRARPLPSGPFPLQSAG